MSSDLLLRTSVVVSIKDQNFLHPAQHMISTSAAFSRPSNNLDPPFSTSSVSNPPLKLLVGKNLTSITFSRTPNSSVSQSLWECPPLPIKSLRNLLGQKIYKSNKVFVKPMSLLMAKVLVNVIPCRILVALRWKRQKFYLLTTYPNTPEFLWEENLALKFWWWQSASYLKIIH